MKFEARQHGFTLIETLLVLAIVGALVAFAVPNFTRYRNREDAKSEAMQIAGALREARARAMKDGVPYIVVFSPNPADAVPAGNPPIQLNTVARLVRDANRDNREGPGETAINVVRQRLPNSTVVNYGSGGVQPFSGAPLVGTDAQNAGATLATVGNGANFFRDPVSTAVATQYPAVGFTTRGVAVRLTDTGTIGSGRGSFYITDGQNAIYAASVGPLGEVRVSTWNSATGNWN